MQNLQTNEALLQHFQVEELEERLENKWGSTTKACLVSYTLKNGQMINPTYQYGVPQGQSCPPVRVTFGDSGDEGYEDPVEVNEQ